MRPLAPDLAFGHLQLVVEFIARSDSKIGGIAAVSIGMLGVLGTKLQMAVASPFYWVAGTVSGVLLSICLWHCYKAYRPALAGGTSSLIYFNSISCHAESDFLELYEKLSNDVFLREIAAQIWRNSCIAAEKYRRVARAATLLLLAVPFWVLALAMTIEYKPIL